MIRSDQYLGVPGFSDATETYENKFTWGPKGSGLITGANFSGAARDSGNTPTTVLRPGLLLGRITASGLLTNYSASATDGSQVVHSILPVALRMQDLDASNKDRFGWVVAAGPVKAASLINLDNNARRQMRGRFLFDDDLVNAYGLEAIIREVAKTADYTVVAADVGTLFTTTGAAGAVNFTLPALAAGLGPFEFINTANQNMTVTAPANKLVTFNNATATSVAFSTAGNKIGARVRVWCNQAGTFYYMQNLSPGNTITVA